MYFNCVSLHDNFIGGGRDMIGRIICFLRSVLIPCIVILSTIGSQALAEPDEPDSVETKTSIHKKDDNPLIEQVVPKIETKKDQTQFIKAETDISSIFSALMAAFPKCNKEFRTTINAFLKASPQSSELVLNVLNEPQEVTEEVPQRTPKKTKDKTDENAAKEPVIRDCHHKTVGKALAGIVASLTETDTRMASKILGLIIKSENPSLQTAFLSATGNMTAATNRAKRKIRKTKSDK